MANGYHLFSTGEVLTAANVNDYLMKQTVMIFASASARTTALSGVLREGMISYRLDAHVLEVYNGTIWEAPETNLTTKGDLATFDTAPTRLAVGSDGQTLVANSANASGLGWGTPSQSNPVLNSCFDIWQRGITSVTVTGFAKTYMIDRWWGCAVGTGSFYATRQATADTTNLPNIQYCARVQRTVSTTNTVVQQFTQPIETANSVPFAGKTVTLSFYARAGANYSSASNVLNYQLLSGTGTDESQFGGYTGQTTVLSQNATLTNIWQRFTYSATVGATATELAVVFNNTPTGTAGANDYYEVTGVQIDIGSSPLPVRRNATTYQGELAACQRYYYRQTATGNNSNYALGMGTSTTLIRYPMTFPVTMRVTPTAIDYNLVDSYDGNQIVPTSLTIGTGDSNPACVQIQANYSSGVTQYRPYILQAYNSTASYVGLSAEL